MECSVQCFHRWFCLYKYSQPYPRHQRQRRDGLERIFILSCSIFSTRDDFYQLRFCNQNSCYSLRSRMNPASALKVMKRKPENTVEEERAKDQQDIAANEARKEI